MQAERWLARLFQTACMQGMNRSISESETAFLVNLDQQKAGATQHRSCCKATGWTWNPKAHVKVSQSGDDASGLRAVEDEIEDVAALTVRARAPEVTQQVLVDQPRVVKRVGQNAHPLWGEISLHVDAIRELDDQAAVPRQDSGINGSNNAEGVTRHAAEQIPHTLSVLPNSTMCSVVEQVE
jgi:hypothetical protein